VTSFVPTSLGDRHAQGRVKSGEAGNGATRKPLGEHGEYPPFDAAEHGDRCSRADSARRNVPG
jgi:hypothetical protein